MEWDNKQSHLQKEQLQKLRLKNFGETSTRRTKVPLQGTEFCAGFSYMKNYSGTAHQRAIDSCQICLKATTPIAIDLFKQRKCSLPPIS